MEVVAAVGSGVGGNGSARRTSSPAPEPAAMTEVGREKRAPV